MAPTFGIAPLRAWLCGLALGLAPLAAPAETPAETAPSAAETSPIVIRHAFGETVLAQKPRRIATVAFGNHEVPLALGVVPVGMAAANFGDDDGDGVLPWVAARLAALGAETPVLFDEGDGIDFEAVAATAPDVILAAQSGLSAADYQILSRIAPVIAYPDKPWTTSWREMVALNAAGMGMAAEGAALIARMEAEIAAAAAAHPALQGRSAMFVTHLDPSDLSTVSFYTDNDTRVQFLHDLGLISPAAVREASDSGLFAGRISAERIDLFDDVDLVVTYGGPELLGGLRADPLTARMPAVARGAVVLLANDPLGTGANPTPLSIGWVLQPYLARLAQALP